LKLLATSHSLHLSSITTTFQALAKPPSITGNNKQQSTNEADLILPLLFEAVMTVSIHDNNLPVKFRCPGIVLGKFSLKSTLLSLVKINLDADSLVSSMVEQARLAVFKAVAVATNATPPSPISTIPQFSTALNLSKAPPVQHLKQVSINKIQPRQQETPKLIKAPSLIINKNANHPRKNRSVTWNHQLESRNNGDRITAKRRKFSEPGNLKSSQSFGKPDASFFQTNRNATFAEFGRPPKHLFVNGKLSTPNNNMRSMANMRAMKSVGNFSNDLTNGSSKGNATFSAASLSFSQKLQNNTSTTNIDLLQKPKALFSLTHERKKRKIGSTDNLNSGVHIPQPSLPRTPTALEGFLLAKTASNVGRKTLSNHPSLKRRLPN